MQDTIIKKLIADTFTDDEVARYSHGVFATLAEAIEAGMPDPVQQLDEQEAGEEITPQLFDFIVGCWFDRLYDFATDYEDSRAKESYVDPNLYYYI